MTGLSGEATAHSPPISASMESPAPPCWREPAALRPHEARQGPPIRRPAPCPTASQALPPRPPPPPPPQRSAGMPRRPPSPSHRGPPPHSRRRPSSAPPLLPATRTGVPHPPTIPIRRSASHRAQRHSIRRAVPAGVRNTNYFSHLQENRTKGRKRSRTAAGKNYVRGPNSLSRRTGPLLKRRRSPSGAPDRWAPQPEQVLGEQFVHGLLKRDEHLME